MASHHGDRSKIHFEDASQCPYRSDRYFRLLTVSERGGHFEMGYPNDDPRGRDYCGSNHGGGRPP